MLYPPLTQICIIIIHVHSLYVQSTVICFLFICRNLCVRIHIALLWLRTLCCHGDKDTAACIALKHKLTDMLYLYKYMESVAININMVFETDNVLFWSALQVFECVWMHKWWSVCAYFEEIVNPFYIYPVFQKHPL